MSDVASPVPQGYAPNPGPPRKGWFGRNWLWFIPMIIILPFVCCCSSCGGCVYLGLNEIQKMPPYKDSISVCQSNTEVQKLLGNPIEPGGLFESMQQPGGFEMNATSTGQDFTATIPMSGPNGSGALHIEATSSDGVVWIYQRQEYVHSDGTTIDLQGLGTNSGASPDDADPSDEEVQDDGE